MPYKESFSIALNRLHSFCFVKMSFSLFVSLIVVTTWASALDLPPPALSLMAPTWDPCKERRPAMAHGLIPEEFLTQVFNDSIFLQVNSIGERAYPEDLAEILDDLEFIRSRLSDRLPWIGSGKEVFGATTVGYHMKPSLIRCQSLMNVVTTVCSLMSSYGPQEMAATIFDSEHNELGWIMVDFILHP